MLFFFFSLAFLKEDRDGPTLRQPPRSCEGLSGRVHEPAPLPNLRALPHQHNRREAQRQRHEPEEAARPPEPERLVHAARAQGQPRGEQVLAEGGGRDGAARERRVRVRQVHDDAGDDGHDAEADEHEARRRQQPVHVRAAARPRVPEQPAGQPREAGGYAQREARLGDGHAGAAAVAPRGTAVVRVLREAGQEAEGLADEEADLDEADLRVGEVVVLRVDEGGGLGRDEDEAEAEGGPEGEEEDDGLGEEESRRAHDGLVEEVGKAGFLRGVVGGWG